MAYKYKFNSRAECQKDIDSTFLSTENYSGQILGNVYIRTSRHNPHTFSMHILLKILGPMNKLHRKMILIQSLEVLSHKYVHYNTNVIQL